MRSSRRTKFLITALPLLVLTTGSVFFLARLSREVSARIAPVVSTEITKRIQGKAEIGSIQVFPRSIVLKDVTISDDSIEFPDPIIKAARIRIISDWRKVLRGKTGFVESIERVDVIQPEVLLLREADGRWNLEKLAKPSDEEAPHLRAILVVRSGRLKIRDEMKGSVLPSAVSLSDVDAVVRLSEEIGFELSAKGESGLLDDFLLDGKVDSSTGSLEVAGEARTLNLAHWIPLGKASFQITSGSGDIRTIISRADRDAPIRYTAHARVEDVSVSLQSLREPVHSLSGDIEIHDGLVGVKLGCRLGSSPVDVEGMVIGYDDPKIALQISSKSANLHQVAGIIKSFPALKGFSLPKQASVQGRIFGSPASPGMDFELSAPSFTYSGWTAKSIRASGKYYDKILQVQDISADAYGGRIDAQAKLDFKAGLSVAAEGVIKGVGKDRLPIAAGYGLHGSSTGEFKVSIAGGIPTFSYNGRLDGGNLKGIGLDDVEISAGYADGEFQLSEASGRIMGGLVAASGSVSSDGRLDIHAAGSDVEVEELAKAFNFKPVVGKVNFTSDIKGTVESPSFEGVIDAYGVKSSDIEIERINAQLKATSESLVLQNLTAYKGTSVLKASGTVDAPLSKSPTLELNVTAESPDIAPLLSAFDINDTTGAATADINISGPIHRPSAQCRLHVEHASFRSIPLDCVDLKAQYAGGGIIIDDLTVKNGDSSIKASGTIPKYSALSIQFSAEQFPISALSSLTKNYVDLAGKLNVHGNISGTRKSPHVYAKIESKNLSLNNRRFTSFDGILSGNPRSLSLSNLKIEDGDASYVIQRLNYQPGLHVIEADAYVSNAQIQKIAALIGDIPFLLDETANSRARMLVSEMKKISSGYINAGITGAISIADKKIEPDLQAQAVISKIGYDRSEVDSIDLAGSWRGGVITLAKFEALDGDTNVSADGMLTANGELSLSLDAHNLDIGLIRKWIDISDNFSGQADVTIVAGGRIDAPESEIYIELVEPVLAGVKFDRLRSRMSTGAVQSAGEMTSGTLHFDEILLMLGEHGFKVSGYIPVNWASFTIPSDQDMLLETKIQQGILEIASAYTGLDITTGPDGEFGGMVKVAGAMGNPKLEGELDWKSGELGIPGFLNNFRDIEAHLALDEDKLTVSKLTGMSSLGGNFDIGGDIRFKGINPLFNLTVSAKDMALSARNLSGAYNEDVQAELNGSLGVTGDMRSPHVSGDVAVPRGTVTIASLEASHKLPSIPAVNPSFAINLEIGPDVELKASRLKTSLAGPIDITGTLGRPVVNGTIDISGGTISLPMRQMRIKPGSTVSVHVSPPEPTRVFVDMTAEGKVYATSVLGRSRRYTVTMAAKGPLENLTTTFSSSPPDLSEQTILALLTGKQQIEQALISGQETDISSILSAALVPAVLQTVGQTFESALGLEEFGLEMGYNEPLRLTIGEQLFDGLYLDYSRLFGNRPDYSDSEYEVTLSYHFRRGLEMGLTVDSERTTKASVQGKLRF